ncbi:MAG: hypothetical protein HMLKMBBP_00143 [Planctomycetes bacterium]|nr:hypothetical protein [Planctomycetota bacterium]
MRLRALLVAPGAVLVMAAACRSSAAEPEGPTAASPPAPVPAPRPAEVPSLSSPAATPDPARPAGFWTEDELRRIDEGLRLCNASRADLGFQKRPIDDPFRLDVVNRALDDPLSCGPAAESWDGLARGGDAAAILVRQGDTVRPGRTRAAYPPGAVPPCPPELEARLPLGAVGVLPGVMMDVAFARGLVARGLEPLGGDRAMVLVKALLSQVDKPVSTWASSMKDEDFLAAARRADLDPILHAGDVVLAAAAGLAKSLCDGAVPEGATRLRADFGPGLGVVVLYGTGDDVHAGDEDAAVVIDLGGNDVYPRGASADGTAGRPVQIVIDLAGDDVVRCADELSCGGALGGVAVHWDCAGDDVRTTGSVSMGAGIFGVGVLVDEGGKDVARSGDFVQGAGAFGAGLLLDRGGNDSLHADRFGQGFASTWGCGVLADLGGNDSYDAGGEHLHAPLYRDRYQALSQGFSIGMRPDASGGVGVLIDASGNDAYRTDIYGQGSSYWYSLGILVDGDGHDSYDGTHYCQGTGIHLSAGILLDRAGNDSYHCLNGVGVGGAHDYAVGFLVDRAGDDHYSGSGGSQGGALTNSVAMLIDGGGNDGYTAVNASTQGSATPARGTGGIGLLLDAGGADVYSEQTRNDGVWTRDFTGAGIDEPSPPKQGGEPQAASITPEAAAAKVEAEGKKDGAWDLDRLWKLASAWEVNDNRVIVPVARERLFELGDAALERAISRVGTKDGLEFRAVEATCAKFREKAVPALLDRTKNLDAAVRRGAVRALTTLAAPEAYDRLVEMLANDEGNRGTVLSAFAALKRAPPEVKEFLRGPKEGVGVQAVLSLAGVGDAAAIEALVGALGADTPFPVRLAAWDRLGAIGEPAVVALAKLVFATERKDEMALRNALRALGRTGKPSASDAVNAGLIDASPWVRLSALEAARDLLKSLPEADRAELQQAVDAAKGVETDSVVKRWR